MKGLRRGGDLFCFQKERERKTNNENSQFYQ